MVCDVSVLYYVSCKISLGRELHVHIDIFWVMATISACPQFRGKMLPPSSQSKHKMKAMYFFLNFFTYLPDYNIRSALFNDAVSYSMIDETNNMKHLCSDTGREHWTAYRNPPPHIAAFPITKYSVIPTKTAVWGLIGHRSRGHSLHINALKSFTALKYLVRILLG